MNLDQLLKIRSSLLALHKALLEYQKREFESANSKIESVNKYFELVTQHLDFAWLKTLSELIVSIDIITEGEDQKTNIDDLVKYLNKLLSSQEPRNDFAEKYRTAIKSDPAVTMCHAEVLKNL